MLNFDEIFVDRELIDDKGDFFLLCLSQIVSMPQNSKPSDISASMCAIFLHEICRQNTQGGHLLFCSVVGFNQFRFSGFLKNFLPFSFVCFQPLHRIDRQPHTKRFGQDNHISRLGIVWHDKVLIINNPNRTTSHHWPHIVYRLPSSDLSLSLNTCLNETLNHQCCRNILFDLTHLSRNPQNHQHFLNFGNTHRIQIRNSITKSNPTKHIGRLNQRIEKVKGRHKSIGLNSNSRNIRSFHPYRSWQFFEV